ncbi:patatin-like phospholipase [Formosa agariphila KMM 3901]|uniref:Patatin-like phospholipase n=1 Tax=Formosa agariphila (strain DSM 15362 / KCTC 12365 / LMG 23005 / KMM 3901 / M-2Alg 35-1) TaxID=1347342 RepID=T2KNR4_FORAG|nr:patatin-like phospholipase family protein [Formosa agariphila]CDF80365.1 patatin-like phospholipase [Formosa agariphila KMM 3901]
MILKASTWNRKKKLGLVLSGGGYRGVSHIGVLKAMEELGIKPDYISGTSSGAIVGSLYAAGNHWQDILDFFIKIELFSFNNFTLRKPGLFDGNKLALQLSAFFKENNFESLEIPMYIATTDLLEGTTRYFSEGILTAPIIASSSVPGMFTPIDFNGYLLCDGGVTNNFPIEPIQDLCDKIIGVYLNPLPEMTRKDLRTTKSVINRSYSISGLAVCESKFKDCDVLISPKEIGNCEAFTKTHIDLLFKLGYEDALEKLSHLEF